MRGTASGHAPIAREHQAGGDQGGFGQTLGIEVFPRRSEHPIEDQRRHDQLGQHVAYEPAGPRRPERVAERRAQGRTREGREKGSEENGEQRKDREITKRIEAQGSAHEVTQRDRGPESFCDIDYDVRDREPQREIRVLLAEQTDGEYAQDEEPPALWWAPQKSAQQDRGWQPERRVRSRAERDGKVKGQEIGDRERDESEDRAKLWRADNGYEATGKGALDVREFFLINGHVVKLP